MKKIMILLIVVCILTLTACGGNKQQSPQTQEADQTSTTIPVLDEQVMEDIKIDIEAALDYTNENENIDGATKFSNAILNGISYEIVYVDKNKCEIIFKYSDAKDFLLKASELLNDNSTDDEIDAVLAQIAQEITTDNSRVIKTVTAEIEINSNGKYIIIWNDDLYDAVSGGLHSMQVEEG